MDKNKIYILLLILFIIILGLAVILKSNFINSTRIIINTPTVTPTPKQSPFLNADSLNLPSSYMGYTFTKLSSQSATLGKNALYYSDNSISLSGTEWIVTKQNVSTSEFNQFKSDFTNFAQTQLSKLGWVEKSEYNGNILQPANTNGSVWGYLKTDNGKIQIILLNVSINKQTCPCNVEFRIFLSNIYSLNSLK